MSEDISPQPKPVEMPRHSEGTVRDSWFSAYYDGNVLWPQTGTGIYAVLINAVLHDPPASLAALTDSTLTEKQLDIQFQAAMWLHGTHQVTPRLLASKPEEEQKRVFNNLWNISAIQAMHELGDFLEEKQLPAIEALITASPDDPQRHAIATLMGEFEEVMRDPKVGRPLSSIYVSTFNPTVSEIQDPDHVLSDGIVAVTATNRQSVRNLCFEQLAGAFHAKREHDHPGSPNNRAIYYDDAEYFTSGKGRIAYGKVQPVV